MDIAKIPIVDFLKYCKEGAKRNGYSWVVCILCRSGDCRNLYKSIERDWQSLDSITGKSMLVLFAGNEVNEDKLYLPDVDKFCITDRHISYMKRYNPFATVIGNSGSIKTDLSSVRYNILESHIPNVEKSQTDAINALRRYFGIENRKSSVRCKVEHAFRIIKCRFGYKKTAYRGLKKNENRLYAMFACANLYVLAIAGRKLSTT